ncbi:MAG TPA: molecular chaperone DnaK, partial [Oculatellaceae cyanobacterium]
METVIGIDLGMTNSRVAVNTGEQTVVIANAQGYRFTPCVVAYGKNGEHFVGQLAKYRAAIAPDNTFYGVKRFIGQRYNDVTDEAARVPYQVFADTHGQVKLSCPNAGQEFAPQEISAMVLQKLKQDAENFLGKAIESAVITVPSHFNDSQRQAIKDAGSLAGLNVLRIINEPTAACLAYSLDKTSEEEIILVFDLGGSTLDITILESGDGVFEVKVNSQDLHLGGDNFDKKIVDWLVDEFQRSEGIDLRDDRQAIQRITEAAEKAKIDLCGVNQVEIQLPFIAVTQEGPKHLDKILSRTEFEQICSDLLIRCRFAIEQALKDAEHFCDEVILVGGSTRIPAIQELVQEITGKKPCRGMNPDEAVVIGAAIQGSVLERFSDGCCISIDMTFLSLGIETVDGITTEMIPRGTIIPITSCAIFSTATDGQTSVEINIVQGQRTLAKDNRYLGTFCLDGIIPAPKGVPQIEVTFEIDCNSILTVSAQDRATDKKQSLWINSISGLSNKEIERMLWEAERYCAV